MKKAKKKKKISFQRISSRNLQEKIDFATNRGSFFNQFLDVGPEKNRVLEYFRRKSSWVTWPKRGNLPSIKGPVIIWPKSRNMLQRPQLIMKSGLQLLPDTGWFKKQQLHATPCSLGGNFTLPHQQTFSSISSRSRSGCRSCACKSVRTSFTRRWKDACGHGGRFFRVKCSRKIWWSKSIFPKTCSLGVPFGDVYMAKENGHL